MLEKFCFFLSSMPLINQEDGRLLELTSNKLIIQNKF